MCSLPLWHYWLFAIFGSNGGKPKKRGSESLQGSSNWSDSLPMLRGCVNLPRTCPPPPTGLSNPHSLPFPSFESLAWRKRVVKSCPAPNRWSSIRQCRSPSSCLTREIFFWADTCLEYTQVILRTRSLSLTLLTLSFSSALRGASSEDCNESGVFVPPWIFRRGLHNPHRKECRPTSTQTLAILMHNEKCIWKKDCFWSLSCSSTAQRAGRLFWNTSICPHSNYFCFFRLRFRVLLY